ncbi:MAG: hypothetical protein KGH49_02265 [Candidatus Micrarchaeota archaeon]|nr:hypothetical protein [Candidatus Micrarchaeota archaeon]
MSEPLMQYRNNLEIAGSILKSCLRPASKTKVMYDARLSYSQLKSHMPKLAEYKLLETTKSGKCVATEGGKKFVSTLDQLLELQKGSKRLPHISGIKMLMACQGKELMITEIMYTTYANSAQISTNVPHLLEEGLLSKIDGKSRKGNGRARYLPSESGNKSIELYKQLLELYRDAN